MGLEFADLVSASPEFADLMFAGLETEPEQCTSSGSDVLGQKRIVA